MKLNARMIATAMSQILEQSCNTAEETIS